MDSMRNYQFFEEDRDGLAVERPADHADFPGLEVAVTNSAPGITAAGSLANQVRAAFERPARCVLPQSRPLRVAVPR